MQTFDRFASPFFIPLSQLTRQAYRELFFFCAVLFTISNQITNVVFAKLFCTVFLPPVGCCFSLIMAAFSGKVDCCYCFCCFLLQLFCAPFNQPFLQFSLSISLPLSDHLQSLPFFVARYVVFSSRFTIWFCRGIVRFLFVMFLFCHSFALSDVGQINLVLYEVCQMTILWTLFQFFGVSVCLQVHLLQLTGVFLFLLQLCPFFFFLLQPQTAGLLMRALSFELQICLSVVY